MSEVWGKGGDGGIELAEEVLRLCEQPHTFRFAYELNQSIKAKNRRDRPQGLWRCGRPYSRTRGKIHRHAGVAGL